MKKDKDIVNTEEWIEIARKDWKRIKGFKKGEKIY